MQNNINRGRVLKLSTRELILVVSDGTELEVCFAHDLLGHLREGEGDSSVIVDLPS